MRCPRCDYDLTGCPENRCPECGDAFSPEHLHSDAWIRHEAHHRLVYAVAVACAAAPAGAALIGVLASAARNLSAWLSASLLLVIAAAFAVVAIGLCFCAELRSRPRRLRLVIGILLVSVAFSIVFFFVLPAPPI